MKFIGTVKMLVRLLILQLSKFEIPYETLTANTGTTVSYPNNASIDEGEFIIKSYWQYNVNTLFAKQEKVRLKILLIRIKEVNLYGLYTSRN